jgi:RNA polymerase sigma-70 factor (ECF subfamily)
MLTFHDLYVSFAPDIYRFAYWLAGDSFEADDITSETFIRAWTRIGSIRTETLKAYLLKIARNVYLQRIRKKKLQMDFKDTHLDPSPGPEKLAEDRSELEMAHRVLQTLSEIDRAAFVLRVQHDLPYAEIGRVLQISEVAAKVKIHRTRKKMLTARMDKQVV